MKGRKERKMKKTLAILLSLALVICMIPATAFAAPTVVEAEYTVQSISIDSIADQTYTGSAITPAIAVKATIKKNNSEETKTIDLTSEDYSVAYSDHTNASTVTVTVTGKKGTSFEGQEATKTFAITALDLSDAIISTTSDILSGNVDGTTLTDAGKSKITIKVGNVDVKADTLSSDVTIDYTYKEASGNTPASVTVTVADANTSDGNVVNSRSNTFTVKDIALRKVATNLSFNLSEPSIGLARTCVSLYSVLRVEKEPPIAIDLLSSNAIACPMLGAQHSSHNPNLRDKGLAVHLVQCGDTNTDL